MPGNLSSKNCPQERIEVPSSVGFFMLYPSLPPSLLLQSLQVLVTSTSSRQPSSLPAFASAPFLLWLGSGVRATWGQILTPPLSDCVTPSHPGAAQLTVRSLNVPMRQRRIITYVSSSEGTSLAS